MLAGYKVVRLIFTLESKWTPAKIAISYCVVHVHPGPEVLEMSQQIVSSHTSIPLVEDLLTDCLTYVGTLCPNKPHLHDAMNQQQPRSPHLIIFWFQGSDGIGVVCSKAK